MFGDASLESSLEKAMSKEVEYDMDEETAQEICSQYQEDIENYAKSIQDLQMSDLTIMMQVMNDMWNNIYGYDVVGEHFGNDFCYNLYYYNRGVCRDFADDYAKRMNEINPEYKAQVVSVLIEDAEVNNIKRYDFSNQKETEDNFSLFLGNVICETIGNHAVVLLSVPNTSYTLVVDPTNPSIGLLENGKIYMLGSDKASSNMMQFSKVKFLPEGGSEKEFYRKYYQSYRNGITIEEAMEKYGIESQNMALEDVQENLLYQSYNNEENLREFIMHNGIQTYTEQNCLCIRKRDDDSSTMMTDEMYHIINLRLKKDLEVEWVHIRDFYDGEISLDKINFPKEKIIYWEIVDENLKGHTL